MTSQLDGTPPVLLHHFKHNKVLHEKVILMTLVTEGIPEVAAAERFEVRELGEGFWEVVARYGFMETPNVPKVLGRCAERGLRVEASKASTSQLELRVTTEVRAAVRGLETSREQLESAKVSTRLAEI